MPEIQYPKNPNSDTAFVVQEDGTKNRALMTAPQDTSSLELPTNSNSCKGYVTVDGKKQRVILTADIGGGGSSLPDQTGQSGKFLTTDGTDASWSDKPLINTATGGYSISFGVGNLPAFSSGANNIVIGADSGSVGSSERCVIIGRAARANTNNAIVLGNGGVNNGAGIAIGNQAVANNGSIQFTMGTVASGSSWITNSDANTFKVGNANGNFEIMSADGTVPHGRLTNAVVSNAVSIAVADWNGGTTCTKTISGLTATSVVWVAPDNASQSDYLTAGVYASAQTTDQITFTATTTPTSALTVNVIYC